MKTEVSKKKNCGTQNRSTQKCRYMRNFFFPSEHLYVAHTVWHTDTDAHRWSFHVWFNKTSILIVNNKSSSHLIDSIRITHTNIPQICFVAFCVEFKITSTNVLFCWESYSHRNVCLKNLRWQPAFWQVRTVKHSHLTNGCLF